jgi:hypothetical protein
MGRVWRFGRHDMLSRLLINPHFPADAVIDGNNIYSAMQLYFCRSRRNRRVLFFCFEKQFSFIFLLIHTCATTLIVPALLRFITVAVVRDLVFG